MPVPPMVPEILVANSQNSDLKLNPLNFLTEYDYDCGMTSLYAVTYMYSINSSHDSFVPVKDATARNHAVLFTNL